MFKRKPKTVLERVITDGDIVVLRNGENYSFYKMQGSMVILLHLTQEAAENK